MSSQLPPRRAGMIDSTGTNRRDAYGAGQAVHDRRGQTTLGAARRGLGRPSPRERCPRPDRQRAQPPRCRRIVRGYDEDAVGVGGWLSRTDRDRIVRWRSPEYDTVPLTGRAILAGTDPMSPGFWGLPSSPGAAAPANPPTGCYFHPRCRFAQDVCKTDEPPLKPGRPGLLAKCHFAGEFSLAGITHIQAADWGLRASSGMSSQQPHRAAARRGDRAVCRVNATAGSRRCRPEAYRR